MAFAIRIPGVSVNCCFLLFVVCLVCSHFLWKQAHFYTFWSGFLLVLWGSHSRCRQCSWKLVLWMELKFCKTWQNLAEEKNIWSSFCLKTSFAKLYVFTNWFCATIFNKRVWLFYSWKWEEVWPPENWTTSSHRLSMAWLLLQSMMRDLVSQW